MITTSKVFGFVTFEKQVQNILISGSTIKSTIEQIASFLAHCLLYL